jgi:hypothetical protein
MSCKGGQHCLQWIRSARAAGSRWKAAAFFFFFPIHFSLRGVNHLLGCEWASSQQVSAGLNYTLASPVPNMQPLWTVPSIPVCLTFSFSLTVPVTMQGMLGMPCSPASLCPGMGTLPGQCLAVGSVFPKAGSPFICPQQRGVGWGWDEEGRGGFLSWLSGKMLQLQP